MTLPGFTAERSLKRPTAQFLGDVYLVNTLELPGEVVPAAFWKCLAVGIAGHIVCGRFAV